MIDRCQALGFCSVGIVGKLYVFMGLCCFASQVDALGQAPDSKTGPVNVVFFLVDDLGWKDLGIYGSEFYETPHVDGLASMGFRFSNAYTPSPVCSPTRAAIMTGKYPSRVGITDWIKGDDPRDRFLLGTEDLDHLPLEEITLAETLKSNGYATFFAGKWHLGDQGFFPQDQGFDINMGGHHMGQPPGGYYAPYHNPQLVDGPSGEFLTDRLGEESVRFLEESWDKPFMLFLSFYTVHTPIQADQRSLRSFVEKLKNMSHQKPLTEREGVGHTVLNQVSPEYASMVSAMDRNVGRVLRKLKDLDLFDNTLIVFTSDNGGLTTAGDRNWIPPTSVRPLRAGKGWLYEGGIRVPLIIKPPGKAIPLSRTVDAQVMSMDFYPTILDYLDLPSLPMQHRDGASLLPVIEDPDAQVHELLFWHYPHYHSSGWKPGSAVRKGPWKLIHYYEDNHYELYNLEKDVAEQHNLVMEERRVFKNLKKELQGMLKRTESQLPGPNEHWEPGGRMSEKQY